MKTLTELIQNYQNGIPDSDSEILKRMEPLVKGYASRIHCMVLMATLDGNTKTLLPVSELPCILSLIQ